MPVCPSNFRPICGGLVAAFENFIYDRVLYRLSRVNTVKLRSLPLSFALLFLIATLLVTLIRSHGVEPWVTTEEWKLPTDTTTGQRPQSFSIQQHRQNFYAERGV